MNTLHVCQLPLDCRVKHVHNRVKAVMATRLWDWRTAVCNLFRIVWSESHQPEHLDCTSVVKTGYSTYKKFFRNTNLRFLYADHSNAACRVLKHLPIEHCSRAQEGQTRVKNNCKIRRLALAENIWQVFHGCTPDSVLSSPGRATNACSWQMRHHLKGKQTGFTMGHLFLKDAACQKMTILTNR